jgi:hypothetical protein
MPRYVILEHDWPKPHWDFMLESETVLETWKLTSQPKPGVDIPAEKSFDHRVVYLDYEGPISGGRGTVSRWDSGTFEVVQEKENRRLLRLHGNRIQGTVEIKGQSDSGWTWRWCGEEG